MINQYLEKKELMREAELHQSEELCISNLRNKECRETIRHQPTHTTATMKNSFIIKVLCAQ
uniref:Uncharacterized protein n=1 Tax=Arundo donax TaxID=35708 RepID=A0A0A9CXE2_ARUDO